MLKRMLCCALCLWALAAAARGETALVSLNVGKADCHLLLSGEAAYLIDAGRAEDWGRLSRALRCLGVAQLDGVILTHTDQDHAGGLAALAASDVPVGAWYSSACFTDVKEHPAVAAAALRGAQVQWLKAGDALTLPEGTLQALAPLARDEEEENNNSLVLRLETPEGAMLLMGDLEAEGEAALLAAGAAAPAAVLKVGHHGREDASTQAFLQAVAPALALISSDAETVDSAVIERLTAAGAQVAGTWQAADGVRITLQGGVPQAEFLTFALPAAVTGMAIGDKSVPQDAVTLRWDGPGEIDLSGWYLVNDRSGAVFPLPQGARLGPGESLSVTSWSSEAPGDLVWPAREVWREGDAARLCDPYGREAAYLE